MDMRKSRVLRKLRNSELVSCFNLKFTDTRAVEIAALSGFDCLWLCMEHVGVDYSVVEHQIQAAKIHDVDCLVRVPKGSYSDYIIPLEQDAAGIMVPHVMSEKEAKQIVRTTRFHPLGRRPTDGGNADGNYGMLPFKEYTQQANQERFIMIQIEDPEPLDELDAICAVEGIDMVFFGPNDYSHAIGLPGELQHPKVKDVMKKVADTANKHGKVAATMTINDNFQELVEMGFRFINFSSDTAGLRRYCREMMDIFKTGK
jgi:4-hydroxy-2-oxoheptanedioate aldolase